MQKKNHWFYCLECWNYIQKAQKISRNHCPVCFASKHVDQETPWDRACDCKWKMIPISYLIANGKIKITFQCLECWKKDTNQAQNDDDLWKLDYYIDYYKYKYPQFL